MQHSLTWFVLSRFTRECPVGTDAATLSVGRNFPQICLVTFSVILYFLYPTLVTQNANMQNCEEFDFEAGEDRCACDGERCLRCCVRVCLFFSSNQLWFRWPVLGLWHLANTEQIRNL